MSTKLQKIRTPSGWQRLLMVTFAVSILACSQNFGFKEKMDDDHVALVNEIPIVIGDINDRFTKLKKNMGNKAYKDEEAENDVKRAILNELIYRTLLLLEAQNRDVTVSEEEITREKQKIAAGLTDEELKQSLVDARMTPDKLEEYIKEELLLLRLMDEISLGIVVGDEEISEYYEQNKADFFQEESVRARHILVSTDEEAGKIRQSLLDGIDFATLAIEVSLSPDAANGGDLGFFHKGQLPRELEEAAFSLKPGRLSQVIISPYGYHVLKLEEKRPAKQLEKEEVKDKIIEYLMIAKKEAAFKTFINGLLEKAEIEYNKKYEAILPKRDQ